MRTKLFRIIAGAALLVATAAPLIAHHSFAAEFDVNKPVKIKGTVVKMEWINPHTWIYIDATDPGGKHLNYEARIEDPKTFLRPWTIRMPLYRRLEPKVQLLEYKCVEFSEELLYGDLKKKKSE